MNTELFITIIEFVNYSIYTRNNIAITLENSHIRVFDYLFM